jgi:predicted ATP-grasp superfamily ATP-dependent carboligase
MMSELNLFSGRTLVVAFEGWNDAGESASNAARFLIEAIGGLEISEVDSQNYYDFQFARPQVSLDEDGKRVFRWPNAAVYRPALTELFNLRVLLGVEPSRNWIEFAREIADTIEGEEIDSVVFLGAMLADTPHTRPIQITATSTNQLVCDSVPAEKSLYEGPVGILSILSAEFEKREIPTMSLWAAVPHYVHNGPVPKSTLALINSLQELLGIQFDQGELPTEAFKWERAVDELAEADEDLAEYVTSLEKTRDENDEATGDTIAAEVEQFLRDADEER